MGKLRILSKSEEPFMDRVEAGRLLAWELEDYGGGNTVVLGIPRGGVVVAAELARRLKADLDVILSRKLGAPGQPELAIGAVSEDGRLFLNEGILDEVGADSAYIEREKARQMTELERRNKLYRAARPKVPIGGKVVIITDDGIATGATMQASLWSVRQEQPKKLIAALPVGPERTLGRMSKDADELLCLRAPEFFAAVGQFYRRFDQVDDEEVLEILRKSGGKKELKK